MSWYNQHQEPNRNKDPSNDGSGTASPSWGSSSAFKNRGSFLSGDRPSSRRRRLRQGEDSGPSHDEAVSLERNSHQGVDGPTEGGGVLGGITLPSASFFMSGRSRWGTSSSSSNTAAASGGGGAAVGSQHRQAQERGSSLVPIWALAHNSKMDHSNKATGVSSTVSPFSARNWGSSNNTFRATTSTASSTTSTFGSMFQVQQPQSQSQSQLHPERLSFDSSQRSWIVSNPTNITSNASVESMPDADGQSSWLLRHKRPNQRSFDKKASKREFPKSKKPPTGDDTKSSSYTHSRDNAVSEYNGTKAWVRSGNKWIMTDAGHRLRANHTDEKSANGLDGTWSQTKRNPTAVSSYGTSHHDGLGHASINEASASASNILNYRRGQVKDAASTISSYAPSSTSGLYTRNRLTRTPGGFPYMPALHLVPKKGSIISGGISGTTGISGGMSSNASLTDHKRFQRSYLLNAKPVSNQTPNYVLQNTDNTFVEKKYKDESESSILIQASSGYDSEREQRLKEWKEKFVQKFIQTESTEKQSPNRRVSWTKSLDSDHDSDFTSYRARLGDWKKEQYHKSSILPNSSRKPSENDVKNQNVCNYESGNDLTNYSVRMRQWREKQYKDCGVPFRPLSKPGRLSERSKTDGFDSDTQSYDSDSSRQRRLKEWKEQFARLDSPVRQKQPGEGLSPLSPPFRVSSISAETGASVELGREDDAPTSSNGLRRSREVPGGGIFPVTSPHRNQRETRQNFPGMIALNSPGHEFEISPSITSKISDEVSTPRRANTSPVIINSKNLAFEPKKNEREPHVVEKAAKFLLGLAPQLSSDDGFVSPTGDCFRNALDINSPCQGLPSFPTDSMLENYHYKSADTVNKDDAKTNERLRDFRSDSIFMPIGTSSSHLPHSPKSQMPTWDNCLYVKAEGARTGKIFITATHLVFIYEDDVSDSILERYGWNRDQIDELLIEMEYSSSRGATPVNVPLNESGEGEGIELIGSDSTNISFMDLLEDGFKTCKQARKDEIKISVDDLHISGSNGADVSPAKSVLSSIDLLDRSIGLDKTQFSDNNSKSGVDQKLQPLSTSSSSLDDSSCHDSLHSHEQNRETDDNTLCMVPNEFVVNSCIIRAFNEEASIRLQHESYGSSIDQHDSAQPIIRNNSDHDYETLTHSVLSTYSDYVSVDPDQERALYISGVKNGKQTFVGIKWPLNQLAEIYDRRYMMKEVGVEIFSLSPTTVKEQQMEIYDVPLGPLGQNSLYLVIPDFDENPYNSRGIKISRRMKFLQTLKSQSPRLNDSYWMSAPRPHRKWESTSGREKALEALTCAWTEGRISNFDYLLRLNVIAGRSFHDPGNYPVMPWVLSNYTSKSVPDLSDERNYRDLSKPMGALCPKRLRKFQDKYASLCSIMDTAIPPFMYGSHYSSTGGVVLHYLVRLRPFAGLHRQLQGGQFDLPDRLFRSVAQTWDICSRTSTTEVKELTPEWYSNPSFLKNAHNFNLGTCTVDDVPISDVILPPWANDDPCKFIEIMQNALESDFCSSQLSKWIDLIFGYKQRGPEAEKANNIFYHLSYYDSDDLAKIDDEMLRTEIELHIADFGSCPTQLFLQPHPSKNIYTKNKSEMAMAHENRLD